MTALSQATLFEIGGQHDPGGKVRIAIASDIRTHVVWSADKKYRYALELIWDESLPLVLFVMMNPSTADETFVDPTVNWCLLWARENGYGGILIGNSCGYRATNKLRLLEVTDPVGPDNDAAVIAMAARAAMVIFAYGQPPSQLRHHGPSLARRVCAALGRPVHVLKLSKDGTPWHPLYLKRSTKPFVWEPKP